MTKNSERLKLQQIIIVLTMLVVIIGVPLILLAVALKLIYYVLFGERKINFPRKNLWKKGKNSVPGGQQASDLTAKSDPLLAQSRLFRLGACRTLGYHQEKHQEIHQEARSEVVECSLHELNGQPALVASAEELRSGQKRWSTTGELKLECILRLILFGGGRSSIKKALIAEGFSLIESWSNSLQTTQVSCETRISILTNAEKSSKKSKKVGFLC